MEDLARVLICGLAGYRLAWLLLYDDGPLDVFARVRAIVGVDEPGEVRGLALLFSCPLCMTVWTASAAWVAWELHWWLSALPAAWAVALLASKAPER